MRVIPIMFSAPMVLALLDGRKSMTRRKAWSETRATPTPTSWQKREIGDRLWVREAMVDHRGEGDTLCFAADNVPVDLKRAPENFTITRASMPGMFMPRWASRLTLIVTATKIERLQNLTAEDAVAEGIGVDVFLKSSVSLFKGLWDSLHGIGAWAENPEVVALTFRVVKQNIDAMPKAEAA